MTTATATAPRALVRSLTGRLVRGSTVIIGPSFDQQELRGKKMVLRSKGMVPCNKKGRCAGDHCIGKAVFVTDPEQAEASNGTKRGKKKAAGWRAGSTKVCLTHLLDEHGTPLVPFRDDVDDVLEPASADVSSGSRPALPALPASRVAPDNLPTQAAEGVTWQALAEAAARRDVDQLIRISRALKTENETLARRLINTIFSG